MILGLLFVFVRTFYLKENKTLPPNKLKTENKVTSVKPPQENVEEKKFQKLYSPSYIRSSDKNELIKLAAQAAGKKDPFINTSLNQKTSLPTSSTMSASLPNVDFALNPSTISTIPSAGNLSVLPNIQAIIPDDEPILKGFIGNKAIINYKGCNKPVFRNQIVEDIKITNVLASDMSIEYMKKGKKYFKQLTPIDNDALEVIK